MKKSPVAHIGIALTAMFVIVFLGLSVGHGGRAAWSDVQSLSARYLVNQWRDGKGPVYSEALWQQTHDDLKAALQLTPDNAQLMEDLGFLYAARAMGLGTVQEGTPEFAMRHTLLDAAVTHYRAATVARPTFPYTWAYLALAKHLKGANDAELWFAFDKAVLYGAREAGVQPAVAQVAFAHWGNLSAERKSAILGIVAVAPTQPRQRLLSLAQDYGVTLPP